MVKFGLGIFPMDLDSTTSLISYAEKIGYDYVWIPDQTFYRDPFVMLGSVAINTEKIQLGVGVTNPYTRHPAIFARAVATVDEISHGRMNLGIGAGNRRELLIPLGFKQKYAAAVCRDAAIIARGLFNGEVVKYRGKVIADGVKLSFKSRRDIPIFLAGRGPKILEFAGEVADGAIIGALVSKEGLEYAFNNIKRGLKKSGRSLEDIDIVSWVTCTITEEPEEYVRRRKPSAAHIIGGAPIKTLRHIGIEDEVIDLVKNAYHRGGGSYAAKYVPDEVIKKLAIFGTAEECAEKIEWLFKQGITQFSLLAIYGDVGQIKETIKTFATQIISKLR